MNDDSRIQPSSKDEDLAAGGPKVGRRVVIKAGAATVAGLALGTSYIKPGVISVGVQDVYAVSHVAAVPQPSQAPASGVEPAAEAKPAVLPTTGEGAIASALPGAVGLLGASAAGLGYGVSRIQSARLSAAAGPEGSSASTKWGLSASTDQEVARMSADDSGDSMEDLS